MPLLPEERTTVFQANATTHASLSGPFSLHFLLPFLLSLTADLSPPPSPVSETLLSHSFYCLPTFMPLCLLFAFFSGPLSFSAYSTVVPF